MQGLMSGTVHCHFPVVVSVPCVTLICTTDDEQFCCQLITANRRGGRKYDHDTQCRCHLP